MIVTFSDRITSMVAKRKPAARKSPAKRTSSSAAKPAAVKEKTLADNIKTVRVKAAGNKVWVLDNIAWEERSLATHFGAIWDKDIKQFIYIGNMLPPDLLKYASEDYSLSRWLEDEINQNFSAIKTQALFTPRPHQALAIKRIAVTAQHGFRGFLEADNVGVGKTLSMLLGASEVAKAKGFTATNPAKLLIICPKAVIPHWRNTIANSGIDNMRIVVINYDRSKNLLSVPATAASAKTTRTKNKRIATSGTSLIKWDIIIADEAHKLKNIETSQRAKAFDKIAAYSAASKEAPFVIWGTATIGQNPLELGYLAPLIGQIKGVQGLNIKNYGRWLQSQGFHVKEGKVGYVWTNCKTTDTAVRQNTVLEEQKEDISRMREMLFNNGSPSIRRNPEDIAGWPEINRITVPYQLDMKEWVSYKKAWLEFRTEMKLHPKGRDPAGALAAQLRFRQKASLIMLPKTVEYVTDLLENNLQVAISVEFMETLNLMKAELEKKGYTVAVFSGANSSTREQERYEFQRGHAQVILFTVEEGVSFHAGEKLHDKRTASLTPRATVIHDIRYSAISCIQIEGRCHRDGQNATVYYPYFEKTVQDKIAQVMIRRMSHMKNLSGDDSAVIEDIDNILESFN